MTETRQCRICTTETTDLTRINDETRENFHSLTNIHLVKSNILSNFICKECKHRLQSTRNYVKNLAENEIRLMNECSEQCSENPASQDEHQILAYFPIIKIEKEEFEEENYEAPNPKKSKLSKNETKLVTDRKRKPPTNETSSKSKQKKQKTSVRKTSKSCEKSLQVKTKVKKYPKEVSNPSTKVASNDEFSEFSHLPTTENGKIVCPDCNRPILKINFKQHIEQKHLGINCYTCDLCSKQFHRRYSLQCHMHVHLKIRPFICPAKCGKSFFSKHGLYFHFKMHHQPLNEFICEICAKKFKQSHLLQEHIDAKHDGVRYKCTYEGCGNQYNTNSGLKKHISSIHECRLEPCEYCGEMFRTGFSLYQHVRINHKERKFVCEYEGCGKKFVIKTNYTDHMKMHTGKRDFTCNICGANYHKKRNLTRHVQVVHQKSRFFCQIEGCNASLCNKDNYRAHLRKVHANHPGQELEKLIEGIAKMKPVYLDNLDGAEDDGAEENS